MREFGRRVLVIICVLICTGAVYECGQVQILYRRHKQSEIEAEKELTHEELEAEEERIADICQAAIFFAPDYDAGKIREALHHKNA